MSAVKDLCTAAPGENRRLELELGARFEGSCGFALVLAPSQMREHGLGPCGRADLHPRRNPLDRQSRFAPQPGSNSLLAAQVTAPPQRLERFLGEGLQPAPFHLPLELLTPRCGVLTNAVLAQQAVHAHGAQHEPNHVRPPPASQTPKTASPPLPPLSGRFTQTNLRFDPFRVRRLTAPRRPDPGLDYTIPSITPLVKPGKSLPVAARQPLRAGRRGWRIEERESRSFES